MSRKSLILLISLLSIALVGISAFQVYWINSVIRLSEERFEKDALESMQRVASRLERNELIHVATNSFAFFGTSPSEDAEVSFSEEVQFSADHDTLTGKFWYRSNSNNQVKVVIRRDSAQEVQEFIRDTTLTTIEVSIVDGEQQNPDLVAKKINTKQKVLTKVVEEMMFHEVRQPVRVHPNILDSLLKHEFASHGIHLKYEFGVFDSRDNNFRLVKAANQQELASSSLRASLFPNDIINNGLSLIVNFPGKNTFLLEKIWLSLLISLVFILTIISVFAYVVYKIVHQKKLADLKNDFINNMTHEFKTPLATVTLASEALSEQAVQANRQMSARYIQVIKEESKRLSNQVEKVLQLASIEQEELTLSKNQHSLAELVNTAVERAKFQVEEKSGELKVKWLSEDVEIFADQSHFSNALFNLLDNAIKYSDDKPEIDLAVQRLDGELSITVKDQGIGMSRDQQRQIFDKFYRVPTGNLHDVKGFGLGLNYAKYIVEAHAGRIELESVPGQGSTFKIIIDLSQHGT